MGGLGLLWSRKLGTPGEGVFTSSKEQRSQRRLLDESCSEAESGRMSRGYPGGGLDKQL